MCPAWLSSPRSAQRVTRVPDRSRNRDGRERACDEWSPQSALAEHAHRSAARHYCSRCRSFRSSDLTATYPRSAPPRSRSHRKAKRVVLRNRRSCGNGPTGDAGQPTGRRRSSRSCGGAARYIRRPSAPRLAVSRAIEWPSDRRGRPVRQTSIHVRIVLSCGWEFACGPEYALEARWQKPFQGYPADGAGLYLLTRPNGAKLWRLNYRNLSKQRTLSFGAWLHVGLADARAQHNDARRQAGKSRER